MRSSTVLALLGATLAVASPVHLNLHKKAIVWDIVTDIVYVTVTEGELPKTSSSSHNAVVTVHNTVYVNPFPESSTKAVVISSSTPSPPPPPATTSSTSIPPPAPATTVAAAAPVITVTPEAAPVITVTPEAAPAASSTPVAAPIVAAQTSASPVAVAPAASPSDYASSAVFYHNQHRSNHSSPDIAWNQTLADWAGKTAKTCVFAHDMSEGTANYGQNIDATGSSVPISEWDPSIIVANAVTNDWYYGEYQNYASFYDNPSPPVNGPEYLHFSQLLWKDSLTVGCATQYCGSNTVLGSFYGWYTVCNYFPVGNMEGEFNTNVLPPTDAVGTIKVSLPSS